MAKTIAVLGALDTKGSEFAYLIEQIRARQHRVLLVDVGIFSGSNLQPDVSAEEVAQAGGESLVSLRAHGQRGRAMAIMARGAAHVVTELYSSRRIDAIVGMGGSGGTAVFSAAVRDLPVGFPKVLVSTIASGNTSSIVGTKDLILIPSVVDVAGLNRISRVIIANAANAVCGMAEGSPGAFGETELDTPMIGVTMLGNTTPAVEAARLVLEAAGYEVLVFHAVGPGGRTLESLAAEGLLAGVLDLTTVEITCELTGTPYSAGPDRLKAAGERGIPQVVSVGGTDFSIFGRIESLPEKYRSRCLHAWNPETTLMRTTPEESSQIGKLIASRANASHGPIAVLLPLQGLSLLGVEGQPFWMPEADKALFQAIRQNLRPEIQLVEMNTHINDPCFAQTAAQMLLQLISDRSMRAHTESAPP